MGFREDAIKILKSANLPPEEEKEGIRILDDAIKAEAGEETEKGIEIVTIDELYKAKVYGKINELIDDNMSFREDAIKILKSANLPIDELYKAKVYDPGAVAAAIGRKKYGEKRFQEMAAAGKRRKKAPKGKAKMRVGGGGRFAKLESEIASKNK